MRFFLILSAVLSVTFAPSAKAQGFGLPGGIQGIAGAVSDEFENWIGPLMEGFGGSQGTTSQMEQVEQESTLTDAEITEDTVTAAQESLYENYASELQTDEVACELTTLGTANAPAQMQQVQDDTRELTEEISANARGETGSLGSLTTPDRAAITASRIATRCSPDENNGNLQEFCEAETTEEANCHIDAGTLLEGGISRECLTEYTQMFTRNMPQIPPGITDDEEIQRTLGTAYSSLGIHTDLIANGLAQIAAPSLPGPEGNNDYIRALLEEVGATEEMIADYLPEEGGISEDDQFEILANFYLANPNFFTDLQMSEANVIRIRTMLAGLNARMDQKIADMQRLKARELSAIAGLEIDENRQGTDAAIISATVGQ